MAWLIGYKYRKELTITGSADGALSDYQLKLTVNRSSGTDSGLTVYIGTKCEADYDDIRVTTSDGETLLHYWIESASASTADIWVEFDSIPANPDTVDFYLYYGKSDAAAVSNGTDTFIFFDDFSGDLSKWATMPAGWAISGGKLSANSGDTAKATLADATNLALQAKISLASDASTARRIAFRDSDESNYSSLWAHWFGNQVQLIKTGEGLGGAISFTLAAGTEYKFELVKLGSTYKSYANDSLKDTEAAWETLTVAMLCLQTENTIVTTFDNVIVRNITATAPTITAWSAESIGPSAGIAPTAQFGTAHIFDPDAIKASSIVSTLAFGTAILTQILPVVTGIAPTNYFGTAALTMILLPPGIAPTTQFGTAVLTGHITISTGIAPTLVFGAHYISDASIIVVYINGVLRTEFVLRGDLLTINDSLGNIKGCSMRVDEGIAVTYGQELIILDKRLGVRIFGGIIKEVAHTLLLKEYYQYGITVQDYTRYIDATAKFSVNWTGMSEKAILTSLFARCPTITVGEYVITGSPGRTIKLDNGTLRDAVQQLADANGRYWYVDYEKRLHYFSSEAAPFNISDAPDNVSTFPYIDLEYTEDIVNTEIRGSFKCWEPGLFSGQHIHITSGHLSWASRSFMIFEVETRMVAGSIDTDPYFEYTVSFGAKPKRISDDVPGMDTEDSEGNPLQDKRAVLIPVTAGIVTYNIPANDDMTCYEVYIIVLQTPTEDMKVDVLLDGGTIFEVHDDVDTRPVILAGEYTGTATPFTTGIPINGLLTAEIVSGDGEGLLVQVRCTGIVKRAF
jgi:hypothetical protein